MTLISKSNIVEAARLSQEHRYNRRVPVEAATALADENHPIIDAIEHHHRQGEVYPAHMRLTVMVRPTGGVERSKWVIDVPMDLWSQVRAASTRAARPCPV